MNSVIFYMLNCEKVKIYLVCYLLSVEKKNFLYNDFKFKPNFKGWNPMKSIQKYADF
ncbi:hypothetical protein C240_3036 [Enterococcus sp. 5H]|nr:hypothetical protein [Enterococcus sp. 5H]